MGIERKSEEYELIGRAYVTACEAHEGQKDKADEPYIDHCMRVAHRVRDESVEVVCAAWLHDVLEDSDHTLDFWKDNHPEIYEAVKLLTREEGVAYHDYIKNLADNDISRKVKIADLQDHLRPMKHYILKPSLEERYIKALYFLLTKAV